MEQRGPFRGWLAVALLAVLQIVLWKLRVHDAATLSALQLGGVDHYVEHHPMMLLAARRLLAGELPLWNPHELCGVPLLAVPHVGVFYPPNLLFLVLDPGVAEEVTLVLHLTFAAICCYALLRLWGGSALAGIGAALAFAWCGRMNTLVNQHAPLIVLTWLPATIWLVERAIRRRRHALPQLALAVCAQILAGSYEGVLLNLQAAGLYAVFRLAPAAFGPDTRRTLGLGLGLLGAVLLGAALTAPQLLPTLELVGRSDRLGHALTLEQARHIGSIPPGQLLAMLVSHRSLLPEHLRWAHVHAGFLSLLAAVIGLRAGRMRPLTAYALTLATLAVLLTAGGAFFELYFATPLGENFRRPWKALALLGFALSLLTGAAIGVLEDWSGAPAANTRRSPVFAAALLLGAALVLWGGIGWGSGSVLAAVGLLAVIPQTAARRGLVVAAVALSSLQLFLAFENPHMRLLRQPEVMQREDSLWHELAARAGAARLFTSGHVENDPGLTAKQAVIRGLASTSGHESLATVRQSAFFSAAGAAPYSSRRFYGASHLPAEMRAEILDRAATRIYLLRPEEELATALAVPGAAARRGFRRLALPAAPHVAGFERSAALARARFAGEVEPVADLLEARRALVSDRAAPVRPVLEPADGTPASPPAPGATGKVRVTRLDPERIEIDVEATGPGYLVLADTWYPGWQARVDGRPTPIHPADLLFRAVAVPAGASRVVFEYRPRSFALGLAFGAGAWLTLAAAWLVALRSARAKADSSGSPGAS